MNGLATLSLLCSLFALGFTSRKSSGLPKKVSSHPGLSTATRVDVIDSYRRPRVHYSSSSDEDHQYVGGRFPNSHIFMRGQRDEDSDDEMPPPRPIRRTKTRPRYVYDDEDWEAAAEAAPKAPSRIRTDEPRKSESMSAKELKAKRSMLFERCRREDMEARKAREPSMTMASLLECVDSLSE